MSTTWTWVTIAALFGVMVWLLSRIDKSVKNREATTEQVRQAGETYFTGKAEVTVDLLKTRLSREQLARVAQANGYEYESVDNRGKRGIFFTFLRKGPLAAPAPFLPESPQYAAQVELEARAGRRIRWYALAVCVGSAGLIYLLSR